MSVRFIVVDDAPFIRELLKNAFQSFGCVCVGEAEDGQEAIEVYRKTLPDLVLLDLVMPIKNGIETAREMKEIWSESVIVACSSLDQGPLLKRALAEGCNSFIVKPFTKKDLLNVMKDYFPQIKEASR